MEDILHIVDTMVEKVGVIVDTKDCSKCGYMELKKKICAIDKYLDANPIVMKLEDVVKQMKEACSSAHQTEVGEVGKEDLDSVQKVLKCARY